MTSIPMRDREEKSDSANGKLGLEFSVCSLWTGMPHRQASACHLLDNLLAQKQKMSREICLS